MKSTTKFKQTEIGMIPEDWEVKGINQLGKIITGKTPRTEDKDNFGMGYPFITPRDMVGAKYISETERYLSEKGKNSVKNCLIPKNSICVSCIGSDMGKVIMTTKESITNQQINSIIPNISPDFVYYAILNISKQLKNIGKQSTAVPILNKTQFSKMEITLPSLKKEQIVIANILSSLDDKIELNQQMNKTLEAIGQAIFKRWFVDFEFPNEEGKPYKSSGGEMVYNEELKKEIPKGWKVSTIGDEFKTILGGTPSTKHKEYWSNGTIPWINSGAINDFPIINASQHITEAGLNNSATQLMPKKTVVLPLVISISKYIRISITGIETSGNQSVLGIVENKKIPCEFIYYWIEKMKDDIYSWATGGAQQHINKKNVDNTLILIPNNDVMNNFKKLLIPIFDKILNNSYEIKTLSQIRDSLLPKLMSGKIRVPVEDK